MAEGQHGAGLTDSVEALTAAFSTEGCMVVDVRSPDEILANASVPGHLNLQWDKEAGSMPMDGLPANKAAPILVH